MADLRKAPAAANYFGTGWDVAVVDLSRIVSFQPTIFDEQAAHRIADAIATAASGRDAIPIKRSS